MNQCPPPGVKQPPERKSATWENRVWARGGGKRSAALFHNLLDRPQDEDGVSDRLEQVGRVASYEGPTAGGAARLSSLHGPVERAATLIPLLPFFRVCRFFVWTICMTSRLPPLSRARRWELLTDLVDEGYRTRPNPRQLCFPDYPPDQTKYHFMVTLWTKVRTTWQWEGVIFCVSFSTEPWAIFLCCQSINFLIAIKYKVSATVCSCFINKYVLFCVFRLCMFQEVSV